MKRNLGTADRAIRFLLGLGLLGAIFLVEGDIRWLGLIGFVPLLTALAGTCPLYWLLGLSTYPAATPKM
jgi:uncharacterized membrane protein YeiB